MHPEAIARLFDFRLAFQQPATLWMTGLILIALILTPVLVQILAATGKVRGELKIEILKRYYSWLVLVVLIVTPILAGAAWTMLGILILSLLCYREYARATGLFRERLISLAVVLGILAISFACLDHWYRLFVALTPLTTGVIAIVAILPDRPKGYIQRVALGVLGYALFGSCLGHLGYIANDDHYRAYLLLIFITVELNDIFAFVVGKSFGKRKLIPRTSPNKTIAGSLGALILTALLMLGLGSLVFQGTVLAHPLHLIIMGILVSSLGQFGDLMLSSIKRDLEIKDIASTIPGHGGLLDRFDSIIIVAPALFHYINLFVGIATTRAPNILTGSP